MRRGAIYDRGFSCMLGQRVGVSDRLKSHSRSICQETTYLLLLPESEQADTRDLDDLETDAGHVTLGLALSPKARNQNLHSRSLQLLEHSSN